MLGKLGIEGLLQLGKRINKFAMPPNKLKVNWSLPAPMTVSLKSYKNEH
jgi:hypothetical protein